MPTGTAGDDYLENDPGLLHDSLDGLAGNDTLRIHPQYVDDGGTVTAMGGDGYDTLLFDQGENIEGQIGGGTVGEIVLYYTSSIRTFVDYSSVEEIVIRGAWRSGELSTGDTVDNITITGALDVVRINTGAGSDVVDLSSVSGISGYLTGGIGNDVLIGGAGHDSISGDADTDRLYGGAGGDSLSGGDGNDQLDGGPGDDLLDGGNGSDWVRYDSATAGVTVSLNLTTPQVTGGAGTDTLIGLERLSGSAFNDRLTGNSGDNTLNGSDGNDRLQGGDGNDILHGGLGSDWALYGTAAAGVTVDLNLNTAQNTGGAGTDILISIANLGGSGFSDTLVGNSGGNAILGGAGDDTLLGGGGPDRLTGGTGADYMAGGAGNDFYVVDDAGDVVTEASGEGADRVRASISYTLPEHLEDLTLAGSDPINGTGNSVRNVIYGNTAANSIDGGEGNDRLFGREGADTLVGGSGKDVLTGGAGADDFLFNAALDSLTNVDRITDFAAADDTIELDRSIFTALSLGTLSSNAFVVGKAAQDADDRIIYESGTGRIYYDPDGTGAGAAVLFAQVDAGLPLTNADFLIVA